MAEESEYPTRHELEKVMAQAVIGIETATIRAKNDARYADVEEYLKSDTTIEISAKDRQRILDDLPSYPGWEQE